MLFPLQTALSRRVPAIPAMLVAVLISFLIMGMWHGNSIGFAVFGLMHGAGVAAHNLYAALLKRKMSKPALQRYKSSRFGSWGYGHCFVRGLRGPFLPALQLHVQRTQARLSNRCCDKSANRGLTLMCSKRNDILVKWVAILTFGIIPWVVVYGIIVFGADLPTEVAVKASLLAQRPNVDTVIVGDSRVLRVAEEPFAQRGWHFFNMGLRGGSPVEDQCKACS